MSDFGLFWRSCSRYRSERAVRTLHTDSSMTAGSFLLDFNVIFPCELVKKKRKKKKNHPVNPMCPRSRSAKRSVRGEETADKGGDKKKKKLYVRLKKKKKKESKVFVISRRWASWDVCCGDTADKASKHVADCCCCSEGQARAASTRPPWARKSHALQLFTRATHLKCRHFKKNAVWKSLC